MSFNSDILLISGNSILSSTENGTIVIGRSGQTININGTKNIINNTDLEIQNNLITLNKGGTSDSIIGAGIEIEENGSATSYIKISNDKNNIVYKTPTGTEQNLGESSGNVEFIIPINNALFSNSFDSGTVSGNFTLSSQSICNFMYNGTAWLTPGIQVPDSVIFTLSVDGNVISSITSYISSTFSHRSSGTGYATVTLNSGVHTITITANKTTDYNDRGICSVFITST